MVEIRTKNCKRHGHADFSLQCDEVIAFDAPWFIGWLEEQVASGISFRLGETVQLGWSLLRISSLEDGLLTLEELDLSGIPGQFERSITRSLLFLRKQKSVLESFGIVEQLQFPLAQQSAIRCNHFPCSGDFVLSRSAPTNPNDSGWFFGCGIESHDHNAVENLSLGSLYQTACQKLDAIEYLAMPTGSLIHLDAAGNVISAFMENGIELTLRPDSYLALRKTLADTR